MKIFRYAAAIALGLVMAGPLSAQTTSVTATIVDTDGSTWINAPYTINIVSPIPPVTNPGNNPFTTTFSGTTNGSGALSATLQRVVNIFPANTTWKFCVTPAVATQTYCVNIPVGNAGQSSQDVSSQINAVIQPPRISGGILAQGYSDTEFQSAGGNQYFNITSSTFRCYTTSWAGCGGTGTGITSITWSLPSILNASPNPLNASGTETFSLATQSANTFFAGPASGGAVAPAFRAIGLTDLPSIAANTVLGQSAAGTPVALAMPSCSTAGTSALIWTTGTGFGCNTITGGGGGTVSSITSTGSTLAVTSPAGPTTNVEINLAHTNTWTPVQNFTGGIFIPGGTSANFVISNGSSQSITLAQPFSGGPSVSIGSSSATNPTAAFIATSGSGSAGLWAGGAAFTSGLFTIGVVHTAGLQLTDSVIADTLITSNNSANAIRLGNNGSASTMRVLSTGVGITGTFSSSGTVNLTGIEASSGTACLQVDTAGAVTNTGAVCGSGGSTSPGGTTGAIQYNNAGAFGGLNGTGILQANGASAPTLLATTGSGNVVLATSPVLSAINVPNGSTGTYAPSEINSLNGSFFVDANTTPTSCTINSVAYTTAFDCIFQAAKFWAQGHSNQNATVYLGSSGTLTTNVGIQEPTASGNHATVNIVGNGIAASILQLSSSLAAGVCMITQPDETTAFNSASMTIRGVSLDLNNNADCVMNIDGVKASTFKDLRATNMRATASGSGGYAYKFGGISSNPNGLVFETFLDNVSVDGLAGGYTPAAISCTNLASAGNPVCTVSAGGTYPGGVGQVQTWGVGNGAGACSVYPTWTLSFTGTALTTITATGGTCLGTVYPAVTPPAIADNAFLFNSGFTDSTVKDARAVIETNFAAMKVLGHPNTFIHYHAYAGQPAGFEDWGSDTYLATECDTLGGYCGVIEGPGASIFGTQEIFNNFTATQGSALFYVDTSITAPTLNANNVTCNGNRQTAGGYHNLVLGNGLPYNNTSTGGAIENGFAIPNDNIQMTQIYDCSAATTANTLYGHIGTTSSQGTIKTYPTQQASATTTGVNGPLIEQCGSFFSGSTFQPCWTQVLSVGASFANITVQPTTTGNPSVQWTWGQPQVSTAGTNQSSVPMFWQYRVQHGSADTAGSMKLQAVPAGSGNDPAVEFRFTHSGSDTGAIDWSFPNVKGVLQGSETVAFSATPTFSNATRSSYMALTGNVTTFTLAAGADGQEKSMLFCQDATGGRTVTAPSNVLGFVPITATANLCSGEHFTYAASSTAWISDTLGLASGGSGTVNSGTANQIAMYSSTGTAVSGDSLLTDNGTTLAYTGTGGVSLPGDGVHAGMMSLYPNTTIPTLTAGNFSMLGPNAASITAFAWQAPASVNGAAGILHVGAPTSAVSQLTVSQVAIADLSATGTPSPTTFLRGDNTWATPSGSGGPLTITGSGMTTGNVYYAASGGLTAAEANASTTVPGICYATSATVCQINGTVTTTGLTAGAIYYVSDSSAGALTATAPTTSTHFVQRFGVALSTTVLLIDPSLDVGGIL